MPGIPQRSSGMSPVGRPVRLMLNRKAICDSSHVDLVSVFGRRHADTRKICRSLGCGFPARGTGMKSIRGKLATRILGVLLLLTIATSTLPAILEAQMQPWLQEEQMRQAYQRQQLLLWRQQEQARQANDRQQWLQWQQQEQARQMNDRQQLLLWQQQERQRQMYQR